jgi:hypothetical protein
MRTVSAVTADTGCPKSSESWLDSAAVRGTLRRRVCGIAGFGRAMADAHVLQWEHGDEDGISPIRVLARFEGA